MKSFAWRHVLHARNNRLMPGPHFSTASLNEARQSSGPLDLTSTFDFVASVSDDDVFEGDETRLAHFIWKARVPVDIRPMQPSVLIPRDSGRLALRPISRPTIGLAVITKSHTSEWSPFVEHHQSSRCVSLASDLSPTSHHSLGGVQTSHTTRHGRRKST